MKPKNAVHKQIWITPDADKALKEGRKARSFRTEREYIERLIHEDFNRLKDTETNPAFQPNSVKLDLIIRFLKPILEQAYAARGLAAHNAIILLSNEPQNRTVEEARALVKDGIASIFETLHNEVKIF